MAMFQAKGTVAYGTTEKNIAPFLEKLNKDKTLVFNLTGDAVTGGNSVQIDLSIQKFSEGVDQLIAELVKADEHCSVLFVADSPPAAISGIVIACAVKSVQTIVKMRAMIEEGITEKEWTLQLIKKSFETVQNDKIEEYDVINSIIPKLPNGDLGKILADMIVDLAGADSVNIRDAIKSLKEKFDKDGNEPLDIKMETLHMLETYFNAVCVCAYIRSEGEEGYKKPFAQWSKELEVIESSKVNGIRFWKDMTFFSLAPVTRTAAA